MLKKGKATNEEEGGDNTCCSEFVVSFKDGVNRGLSLTLCLLVAASVVGFGIAVSLQSSDLSSQTLVLTGVRSRDWLSPNAYSMHGAMEDEHTRLYVCMKQAKLVGESKVSLDASLENYRSNMITYFLKNGRNCDTESDFGFPRDYGFTKCVTDVLRPSSSAARHFLACQDRTEGVMIESLQTLGSRVFLGSYNQVAMLLVSAAVLSTFVMFLSGGLLLSKKVAIDGLKIKGYDPLSTWSNIFALVLSLAWVVLAFIYAFPWHNIWSDVPMQNDRLSFPNTPWTGYIATLWFFGMFLYFSYHMANSMWGDNLHVETAKGGSSDLVLIPNGPELLRITNGTNGPDTSFPLPSFPRNSTFPYEPAASMSDPPNDITMQEVVQRLYKGQPPIPSPLDPNAASMSRSRSGLPPTLTQPPATQGGWPNTGTYGAQPSNFSSGRASSFTAPPPSQKFPFSRAVSFAGSPQNASYVYSNQYAPGTGNPPAPPAFSPTFSVSMLIPQFITKDESYILAQTLGQYDSMLIVRAFPTVISWALLFADGPLLLGMLNMQNSPLNETVIDVFFYITLCRILQLAASFYLNDFLAGKYFSTDVYGDKVFYANFIACHLASVCCFIIACYHFALGIGYTMTIASLEISRDSNGLQISLIATLGFFELLKVFFVGLAVFQTVKGDGYLTCVRYQFVFEWMVRLLFIYIAIFIYSAHLRDQNDVLVSFLS